MIPLGRAAVSLLLLASASGPPVAAAPARPARESGTPEPAVVTVEIRNLRFSPAEIRVAAGTTVRWTNLDPLDHDVTSGRSLVGRAARSADQTRIPDGRFSSGLFGQGRSFSYTFEAPGAYPYYCDVHPFMIGRIVVEGAGKP